MTQLIVNIVLSLIGGSALIALLIWLLGKWVGSRIDSSIKHEYDLLRVKYEADVRRRERAQLVAELLAEWMASPIDSAMTPEQRKKLNRLSFEATLWLPEKIAIDFSRVLQLEPGAPSMFDLLLRTRTHLSGPHKLEPANVTQWDRTKELPNQGLPPGVKNGQVAIVEASVESGGNMRVLSDDEMKNGVCVPEGDTVHLQFPETAGRMPTVASPSIRSLRLVEMTTTPEHTKVRVLNLFPLHIANEINRNLSLQSVP